MSEIADDVARKIDFELQPIRRALEALDLSDKALDDCTPNEIVNCARPAHIWMALRDALDRLEVVPTRNVSN